jgi:hypothetical protein
MSRTRASRGTTCGGKFGSATLSLQRLHGTFSSGQALVKGWMRYEAHRTGRKSTAGTRTVG